MFRRFCATSASVSEMRGDRRKMGSYLDTDRYARIKVIGVRWRRHQRRQQMIEMGVGRQVSS